MALPAQKATGDIITATDHNALIPLHYRIREEYAANTSGGGASATTWTKRPLNTTVLNEITGASMASSVITLPAGVYDIDAWAVAFAVNSHKIRLRQTSGTPADLLYGSNAHSASAAAAATESWIVNGRITLAGSTTLELQHYTQALRATNGFGVLANIAGINECYSEITIRKVG